MNRFVKSLVVLVLLALVSPTLKAQSTPQEAVGRDYPGLSKMYGIDELEKQKAHYIFAIDVSSFMRTNLEVIKPLIKEFILALPDGDQVTFIRKSSTENTDYVQNIKSVQINSTIREKLPKILDGVDFQIQNAGSDGYAMTDKILEAIMNPMSEGLVFVFMFTDFEYWTQQNQYDKSKEDWNALKEKFQPFLDLTRGDQSRVVFPYAFYFRDNEYRENADYRPELKSIFGSLNQPPAGESSILKAFFANMEANAMVYRLKYKIFQDLAKVDMASQLTLTDDDQIVATVSNAGPKEFPLFTQFDYEIVDAPSCLSDAFVQDTLKRHELEAPFTMFSLNRNYKPFLPRFVRLGGDVTYHITPLCEEYANELDMLNGLDQSLRLDYDKGFEFTETLPEGKYFFHILPGWVDILILALIALWLLALLVTFLINKFGGIYRRWNITVKIDDGNTVSTFAQAIPKSTKLRIPVNPASIGIFNGDNWEFEIITVKSPIYYFWKPRGYYLKRKNPAVMHVERRGKVMSLPGTEVRVSPLKKWGRGCTLTFTVNGKDYAVAVN